MHVSWIWILNPLFFTFSEEHAWSSFLINSLHKFCTSFLLGWQDGLSSVSFYKHSENPSINFLRKFVFLRGIIYKLTHTHTSTCGYFWRNGCLWNIHFKLFWMLFLFMLQKFIGLNVVLWRFLFFCSLSAVQNCLPFFTWTFMLEISFRCAGILETRRIECERQLV